MSNDVQDNAGGEIIDRFAWTWEPVAHWARETPDAPAIGEGDAVWSYDRLWDEVGRIERWLDADAGVGPGDRVLVVMENGAAGAAALLAIQRRLAWAVPVNARLTAREIDDIREHARPRAVLLATGISAEARAHAVRLGAVEPAGLGGLGLAAAGAHPEAAPEAPGEGPAGTVGALLYTTGTTGAPKGVMLSHRNLMFMAARARRMRRIEPSDRVYGALPTSHVFGLTNMLLAVFCGGARVDLVPRFDAAATLHALEHDGITILQGVPQMHARLIETVERRGEPVAAPALRYVSSGGAPLDIGLKRSVEATFGRPLYNGYGLTESCSALAVTATGSRYADGTVGTAFPDVELRIAGDDGADLPQGEVGEIRARGDSVMLGYYRDPARTAEAITPDGWLCTGDLGRLDADGKLYVVGRRKELIIRSGFNVYPPEVESVLTAHPDVSIAAVIGLPVDDGNEEVVAFVQPPPGRRIDVDDLAAFAAERLAPYKRPSRYIERETLPATATGKILKQRLRQELEA